MWYVGKFDEANWNLFARGRADADLICGNPGLRRGRGFASRKTGFPPRQPSRELRAGDIVEVKSVLLEISGMSIRFRHEMRNAATGEIAASCEITAVHLDRQARKGYPVSRRRPQLSPKLQQSSPPSWSRRKTRHAAVSSGKIPTIGKSPQRPSTGSRRCGALRGLRSPGSSLARSTCRCRYSLRLTQQIRLCSRRQSSPRGLDNACGIAAFTLMPSGSDVSDRGIQDQICWRRPKASDFPSALR